ncbi:hypothetical protein A8990_1377 [Paenibacillus taihuensis]|uniref:Uncharacterized protein n=1 Tax=Paenibacillus taihuensis TaxID=1156355 RepID=A0A3D9R1P3_9BACL|nr:hypothetical protein [Paenibacillus taihuensis]REE68673.1 hypothetical protein A8990_1377 [Paenibacillus taihuensis]
MAAFRSKRLKTSVLLAAVVILVGYYVFGLSGYSLSKEGALHHAFPQAGAPVYKKTFGSETVLIAGADSQLMAYLIHKKWGFLYRIDGGSGFTPRKDNEPVVITWSASSVNQDEYEVLLAAKVEDPSIHKVIIGHSDNRQAEDIEIEVENGFAVTYVLLPSARAGMFVFRGVNDDGQVLAQWEG